MVKDDRRARLRDPWALLPPVLTLLGVVLVVTIPMVTVRGPVCPHTRPPGPGVFVPDVLVCTSEWSAKAQEQFGLKFLDEADLVLGVALALSALATLPLLVPAWLCRSVTIMVGVVVAILMVRLWLVAPLRMRRLGTRTALATGDHPVDRPDVATTVGLRHRPQPGGQHSHSDRSTSPSSGSHDRNLLCTTGQGERCQNAERVMTRCGCRGACSSRSSASWW